MVKHPVHLESAFSTDGWEPHPFVKGLERKTVLSRERDGADITVYCFRGAGEKIEDVPFHMHENADEFTYVLRGSGKFEIEGQRALELRAGSVVCVPKGTRHRAFDSTEDLTTLNIYSPAIA